MNDNGPEGDGDIDTPERLKQQVQPAIRTDPGHFGGEHLLSKQGELRDPQEHPPEHGYAGLGQSSPDRDERGSAAEPFSGETDHERAEVQHNETDDGSLQNTA